MYIKDRGTIKPRFNLQENEQIERTNKESNDQNRNNNQPIIYIINSDNAGNDGYRRERRNNYYRRGWGGGGGGIFSGIFRFVYTIRSLISFVLIAAIIIGVIILIQNPNLLNNLFTSILKKVGLYDIIIFMKKMIGYR